MFFALFAGSSCSLFASEDTFTADLAQISCERAQECYKANFEVEYDDVTECVDDAAELAEDNEDFYDDCDFDDEKAAECLAEMREISCGDLLEEGVEDCAEVWDCDGSFDTAEADADTDSDSDSDSDADADSDTDRDPTFTDSWSASGVTLSITRGSGTYSFGMAETNSGGWEGEDCLEGPGPSGQSGNYDICHDGVSSSGISLSTVRSPTDVESNNTTLLTDTIANGGNLARIAYSQNSGDCWTWGSNDGYYEGSDCTEL